MFSTIQSPSRSLTWITLSLLPLPMSTKGNSSAPMWTAVGADSTSDIRASDSGRRGSTRKNRPVVTLLRPRWIAGHLLVLGLTVAFIAAGFWQLARNEHKHALVRKARAEYSAPAPDISRGAVAAPGDAAQASGHYDAAHE